jgi:hypothetical protein
MKTLLAIFLATLFAASSHGQTVKALSYNVTNSTVIWTNTNALKFDADVRIGSALDNITISQTRIIANSGKFFSFEEGRLNFGGGALVLEDMDNIQVHGPIEFNNTTNAAQTRTNLSLGWPALTNSNSATALLGYDTNGAVVYTNTNALTFVAPISVRGAQSASTVTISDTSLIWESLERINLEEMIFYGLGGAQALELSFQNGPNISYYPLDFGGTNAALHAAQTRTNLGLGATNSVTFESVIADVFLVSSQIDFDSPSAAAATRTNLGLGATNNPAFRGLTSDGNIVITNQSATNNGLLFVYRTNNEPFLGLANLLASNNTTISNETLFRVGVAEATNQSAQFGFRSTNTNGSGVAVFSVFGYNALMQIGADASTNAVIFSGGGTNNEVMTLIRDGATEFARPIRFSTNASTRPATNAPANTTNVVAWVEMRIGTNSYRAPLYQ